MEIEVRPFDGDPRDYMGAVFVSFAEQPEPRELEPWSRLFEPDRTLAAYDDGRVVGTAAILAFELTVPGGVLPGAGVSVVGVHPTHRRRGILRRMMERQLADLRERGEPIAVLWASDAGIYQRFGYGLASLRAGVKVERQHNSFRLPHEPAGRLRLVDDEVARVTFPRIYDAVRPSRPGFFSRSPSYWDAWTFNADLPAAWREGRGRPFHVLHEVDGQPDGYAQYAIRSGERNEVSVMELVSATPAAQLDLWRYLLDIDLMSRTENWNIAVDDPLLLAVTSPRRLEMTIGDALWLRIVDVAGALAGRRYAADGRLVMELSDGMLPSNAGRWSLRSESGSALVEPTADAAELAVDTTDLAAAYLGGVSFARLAGARRITELQPGAVERADRLFGTSRAPWAPGIF